MMTTTPVGLTLCNLTSLIILVGPAMVLGIKKSTYGKQRSLAYSLFFGMLALGICLSGPLVDLVRNAIGDITIEIANEDYKFSAYRLIFFAGFILTFSSFLIVLFFYKEIDIEEAIGISRQDSTS